MHQRPQGELDDERHYEDYESVVGYKSTEEVENRDNDAGVNPAEDGPAKRNELGQLKVFVGLDHVVVVGEKRIAVRAEEEVERCRGSVGRVVVE